MFEKKSLCAFDVRFDVGLVLIYPTSVELPFNKNFITQLTTPMRRGIVMVLVCVGLFNHGLNAQQAETTLMNTVIPLSPNASALAKFGDVPVSYYTGTPNISVPIYDLNQGGLSLPISINYHASGIRVDDIASWVGTGWSLNAGGMISRSVRGLPDEKETYGFFTMGNTINDEENSALSYHYLYNVAARNVFDSEPDLYFLSLPTESIRFTFDTNQNPVLQNYQQTKIERIPSTAIYGSQWKVTSADGTQYFFGEQIINSVTYGGVDKSELIPEGKPQVACPSSWYLYKILSADGFDSILFQYDNEDDFTYDLNLEETYSERDINAITGNPIWINCQTIFPRQTSPGTMHVRQKTLSQIKCEQGTVDFGVKPGRYDINADRLFQVTIKDSYADTVKYFRLTHSYFGSAGSYRLKLDQVTEYANYLQALPSYGFQYDETYPLPARGSFKQDHWGYFNANDKDTFVPENIERGNGTFLVYPQGGNRDTHPLLTKAGMLTKITYPTGGYDVFDYEAHEIGIEEGQTVTVYDDVVVADLRANPAILHSSVDTSANFTLTEAYSADISIGGGKHGTVSVAGGSSISGNPPANLAWSTAPGQSSQVYKLTLYPGVYHCEAFADWESETSWANSYVKVVIHRPREVTTPDKKVYAGGVRIARISRYDNRGGSPMVTRFLYKSRTTDLSSGVLVRKPKYYFNFIGSTAVDGGTLACPYEAGYSSSKVPLGEGTHIGYSEVTVLNGENGENGYQVLKYTTAADFPDDNNNVHTFPFPPPESHDSRRGLLLESWTYDKDNHEVAATINAYTQRTDKYKVAVKGLRVAMRVPREHEVIIQPSDEGYYDFLLDFGFRYYKFLQEWQYLSQTKERIYSSLHDGTYTEKITNYSYDRPDNHTQLTRTEISKSDGSALRIAFKYPQDYAATTELSGIASLRNAHIFTPIVEEQTWRVNGSDLSLIASKITDYDAPYFQPKSIWMAEVTGKVQFLNNESLSTNFTYSHLLSDTLLFSKRVDYTYDHGRIKTQALKSNIKQAYIWGYNYSRPIAEVINVESRDIAYTSFEDNSDGNWTLNSNRVSNPFTGKKAYGISTTNTATISGLNLSKRYSVVFWAYTGGNVFVNGIIPTSTVVSGNWTRCEAVVSSTTSVVITGVGTIDELRVFPTDAQMKTLTFSPLVGPTSIADQDGIPTFYEYDSFGRLSVVKDYQGKILKVYEYHYRTP